MISAKCPASGRRTSAIAPTTGAGKAGAWRVDVSGRKWRSPSSKGDAIVRRCCGQGEPWDLKRESVGSIRRDALPRVPRYFPFASLKMGTHRSASLRESPPRAARPVATIHSSCPSSSLGTPLSAKRRKGGRIEEALSRLGCPALCPPLSSLAMVRCLPRKTRVGLPYRLYEEYYLDATPPVPLPP